MAIVINGSTGITGPQTDNDVTLNTVTVGLGGGSVATNTAVGVNALAANTTGTNCTAVGWQAANSNTTGVVDAFGRAALIVNTTGTSNAAFATNSLSSNTTGSYNTAIGYAALVNNTTANNNTAVGYQAGYSNTTANFNTFIGNASGYANTTGFANTTLGYVAAYNNTKGNGNTFLGYAAGFTFNDSTGANIYSTFVGANTGYSTTTGVANTFVGASNTGYGAGYYVTTGSKNTILGGYNGNQGGLDIRTASNYIVLSDGDGNPRLYCNTSSNYWNMNSTAATGCGIQLYNQNYGSIVGSLTAGLSYDQASIGDMILKVNTQTGYTSPKLFCVSSSGGVYLATGATSWTANSDARLKNITGTYTNALDDIAKIQPVKFTWKADKENTPQVGVVAQSVQDVVPEAIAQSKAIEGDETEYLGVRYTELIPLMIASIQALKAENDALTAKLKAANVAGF